MEEDQLFKPFYTSKELGLGLVVSQRIVESLGGKIWIESDFRRPDARSYFIADQMAS